MKKIYRVHKDFMRAMFLEAPTRWFSVHFLNMLYKVGWYFYDKHKEVKVTPYKIKSADGAKIRVHVYEPPVILEKNSCLIYYHGGGFMLSISPQMRRRMEQYAIEAGCIVVLVDYRLMPKYRHPKALEDAYAALLWVKENAKKLKVDMNKIALAGDSAGGFLTMMTTHAAMESGDVNIRGQVLIYPVVDYRMTTQSMEEYKDTPIWNGKKNRKMWQRYLTTWEEGMVFKTPMERDVNQEFSKTYIEVAEFDCLRDEALDYGKRLQEQGVDVITREVKGGIHGYDNFESSRVVHERVRERLLYLRKIFNFVENP